MVRGSQRTKVCGTESPESKVMAVYLNILLPRKHKATIVFGLQDSDEVAFREVVFGVVDCA